MAPRANSTYNSTHDPPGIQPAYAAVARAMSAWDSKPYVCVPFETLTQLVRLPETTYVCNPKSKAVRGIHVCSRRHTEKARKEERRGTPKKKPARKERRGPPKQKPQKARKERRGPPKEKPQRGASLASLQRQAARAPHGDEWKARLRQRQAALAKLSRARARQRDGKSKQSN